MTDNSNSNSNYSDRLAETLKSVLEVSYGRRMGDSEVYEHATAVLMAYEMSKRSSGESSLKTGFEKVFEGAGVKVPEEVKDKVFKELIEVFMQVVDKELGKSIYTEWLWSEIEKKSG